MERNEVLEKVKKIIEDSAGIPAGDISEESSIVDDLELSSLEVLMAVGKMESEFGIKIQEKEFLKIEKISDILDVICQSM